MRTYCLFLIIMAVLLSGCDDFFEKDISGEQVELLSPADSVKTIYGSQIFMWSELQGATSYRLMIATPSFISPELCLLDTLVNSFSFDYKLQPGCYAWKVRAENSAWKGDFSERTLMVLPTNTEP